MIFSKNLKTSDKITLYFSLFNFLSLVVLLIVINITYFFIWYNEQKAESLYDMNTNYSALVGNQFIDNKVAFREYILERDTIIISETEDQALTCSEGVSEKLHNDMELLEQVKDSLFYKDGETIYFIFSRVYDGIWEVKIFFDTTDYIHSQIIIIKVSVTLIFLWFFIYLFGWKLISRFTLRSLKEISTKAKNIDLDKKYTPLNIQWSEDDEIQILATALNNAFEKIEGQTHSLKQFITDVSHEFKTPLMVINSDIDVYEKKKEKGLLQTDDDSLFLKSIRNKTAKLNTLIETLFLLTRSEENISKLQFRQRDIWTLSKNLIEEKLKNYTEKEQIISYNISKEINVSIEESSYNIIIENLISNAVKFSKSQLKLDVNLTDNYLEIKDYGIWMPTEQTEKVWEKFYRLDTNIEWFWVGLFLVKRIIQMYAWKITLESKKWQRTSFKIYFTNT